MRIMYKNYELNTHAKFVTGIRYEWTVTNLLIIHCTSQGKYIDFFK